MKSFFLLSNFTGDLAKVQQSPFGGNERHFGVGGLQVTLAVFEMHEQIHCMLWIC